MKLAFDFFIFEPAFDVLKQSWRRTRRTSASARRFLRPRQSILCPARTSADGFGLEQRGAVGDGRTSGRATAWWLRGVYIHTRRWTTRARTPTCRCMYCSSAPGWKRKVLGALSALVSFCLAAWLGCRNLYNRPTNDHSAAYLDSPLGTRCAGGCQA